MMIICFIFNQEEYLGRGSKHLIQAFFAEILNEINDEKVINHIEKQISIKLA